MEPVTIEDLLAAAAEGKGRIVCASDLNKAQIERAIAASLLCDSKAGLPFVLLPWEFRTAKEAARDGAADPDKFAN